MSTIEEVAAFKDGQKSAAQRCVEICGDITTAERIDELELINKLLTHEFANLREENERLKVELAECKRDTVRYRWLRDKCDTTTGFLLCQRLEADEWDEEIDAAISKGGEDGN